MAIILKANKADMFVSSVLFVFWYNSPNFLDTLRTPTALCVAFRLRSKADGRFDDTEHRN
jgi:hypothetical protein